MKSWVFRFLLKTLIDASVRKVLGRSLHRVDDATSKRMYPYFFVCIKDSPTGTNLLIVVIVMSCKF
jgi:hypothetical protein